MTNKPIQTMIYRNCEGKGKVTVMGGRGNVRHPHSGLRQLEVDSHSSNLPARNFAFFFPLSEFAITAELHVAASNNDVVRNYTGLVLLKN